MRVRSIIQYAKFSELSPSKFQEILQNLHVWQSLQTAQHIIIKPNLCGGSSPHYDAGCGVWVTSQVTARIVNNLLQLKSEGLIYIVESDSTGHGYVSKKFLNTGLRDLSNLSQRVRIFDLTRSEHEMITLKDGLYFKRIDISELLTRGYFFISLAKIKTHNISHVSGVLKNQFGCLPYMRKNTFHPNLSKVIADVNSVIKTDLCILEAVPGMGGDGPVRGTPIQTDFMMLSNDPVAADSQMCRLLNILPHKVHHIKLAEKRGIGTADSEKIQVINNQLASTLPHFQHVPKIQRQFVALGLGIQRVGEWVSHLGHLIHAVKSITDLLKFYKIFKLRR